MRKGFTMIEVMVCMAIVSVLSGISFVLLQPAREQARQVDCMSHFKNMYQALQIYSSQYEGPEQLPGMNDIKFVPTGAFGDFINMAGGQSIFHCPNATPKMREANASTYILSFFRDDWEPDGRITTIIKSQLEKMGSRFPLATCTIHDETYYLPREQDVNPLFLGRFAIKLNIDGSVSRGRDDEMRSRTFTTIAERSEQRQKMESR